MVVTTVYVCVYVCVCVRERERESLYIHIYIYIIHDAICTSFSIGKISLRLNLSALSLPPPKKVLLKYTFRKIQEFTYCS